MAINNEPRKAASRVGVTVKNDINVQPVSIDQVIQSSPFLKEAFSLEHLSDPYQKNKATKAGHASDAAQSLGVTVVRFDDS